MRRLLRFSAAVGGGVFAVSVMSLGLGGALALALLGARPAARSALLSGPYQRAALKQPTKSALDAELLRLLAGPASTAGALALTDR